jgi:hypothetical protein
MSAVQPGILALWLDLAPEAELEVNEWFNREHHGERIGVPGFLAARRYVAERGAPKYFIFYRTRDLGVLSAPAYLERLNHPTPWTRRTMPHFRSTSRSACRELARCGRGEGGMVATLRFSAAAAAEARLEHWLRATALPAVLACPGIVSTELWQADPAASDPDTAERRMRGGPDAIADRIVVLSGNQTAQLEAACAGHLAPGALAANGGTPPEVGIYRLLFALGGLG